MVVDPANTTGGVGSTGYQIVRNAADGRITVSAPYAELGDVISVTR
jgi:hypothetical protein